MFKIFKPYPTEGMMLLVIMMTTIVITFLYGIYTMGGALRFRAYLPVARYIFPVIVPIALDSGNRMVWLDQNPCG